MVVTQTNQDNKKMKVLFDTNILFSALGRPKDINNELEDHAKKVIQICDERSWEKCISIRTRTEIEKGWNNPKTDEHKILKEKILLSLFFVLPYHHGNENWEEVDANWEEDESIYGDYEESENASNIEALIGGGENNVRRDRGILIDAIKNKCQIVVSEDWNHFKKVKQIANGYNIEIYKPDDFIEKYEDFMTEPKILDQIVKITGMSIPLISNIYNDVKKSIPKITLIDTLRIFKTYSFKKPITGKSLKCIYWFDKGRRSKNYAQLAVHFLKELPDPTYVFDNRDYLRLESGEKWIDKYAIQMIEESLNTYLVDYDMEKCNKYCQVCIKDIQYNRSYMVPENGLCEFKVCDIYDDLLGINRIRFVQEYLDPPEVFIRILFNEPSVVEIIKISLDGSGKFCIGQDWSEVSKILLKICAYGNYRDLVKAPDVYSYFPGIRSLSRPENYDPTRNPIRYMPRKRYIPILNINELMRQEPDEQYLDDEYTRDENFFRRPGYVTGHLRYLGDYFIANWIKEEECRQYLGQDLPSGYTFVNQYYRGESSCKRDDNESILKFRPSKEQEELTYKSLFYSPAVSRDIKNIVKYRVLDSTDLKRHFS